MNLADKKPWPDDEKDPANAEEWGWWDETPHRVEVDGASDPGNIPTPLFDIMWDRNPTNRRDMQDDGAVHWDPKYTFGRWLMWDAEEYAAEELRIAVEIYNNGGKT